MDYFKSQSLLLAIEQLNQNDYVYPRNFDEFMVIAVLLMIVNNTIISRLHIERKLS